MAKPSQPNDERPVEFYEQLSDIINDVPADILNSDDSADDDADDDAGDDSQDDAADDSAQDDDASDDKADDDSDDDDDDSADDDAADDNDDYFTKTDDDDDGGKKPAAEPAAPPAAIAKDDAAQFILSQLTKIPVRIVVAGADGKDVIETVQVYGNGDLPDNFKGFATPKEGELFRGSVTAQEIKAQRLQEQYAQKKESEKAELQQAEYAKRENKAIAGDLTELRKEGIFPKFKGTPGTKEFNQSDGAKEFDRTVAFMNKKNDQYLEKANAGGAYRHIGFREAFEMLHGQNPKAAEQAEDRARKKIAGKVVSKRGAKAQTVKAGAARVNNMTDLADEFTSSLGTS